MQGGGDPDGGRGGGGVREEEEASAGRQGWKVLDGRFLLVWAMTVSHAATGILLSCNELVTS